MKKLALGIATAMVAFGSAPASAAMFNFNFSGTGLFFGEPLVGSGTLSTSDVSQVSAVNGYTFQTITGITGSFNGSNITGLANVTGSNNQLYLTGPFFLDGNGLGFSTAAGSAVNLFVTNGTGYRVNAGGLSTGLVTASASPVTAAVPEPAMWAMMLLGFGGIGFAMRRRSKVRTTVAYA